MKYNHGEAFMLMTYVSDKLKVKEVLWNSRDGVTPFMIGPKKRNGGLGMLQHIDWNLDQRAVDHQPKHGDRIFIDYQIKNYIADLKTGRVEEFWDHPEYPIQKSFPHMTKAQIAFNIAKQEWQEGCPQIVEIGKDGRWKNGAWQWG